MFGEITGFNCMFGEATGFKLQNALHKWEAIHNKTFRKAKHVTQGTMLMETTLAEGSVRKGNARGDNVQHSKSTWEPTRSIGGIETYVTGPKAWVFKDGIW